MKKKDPSKKKLAKKILQTETKKQKNLFDHLEAIRTTKKLDYFESLSEKEQKSFNHWAILHGLSMDIELTELVSFLWRDGYYDKIPSPLFYRVLLELVPQTKQRLFWIKKTKKVNQSLLKYISDWYSTSLREAEDYLDIFMSTDDGIKEIGRILEGMGLSDKEAESIFTEELKNE